MPNSSQGLDSLTVGSGTQSFIKKTKRSLRRHASRTKIALEEGVFEPGLRRERLAYYLDNAFEKSGTILKVAVYAGLFLVTLGGLCYQAVWRYKDWPGDYRKEEDVSRYREGFWRAWTFLSDPGNHAEEKRADQRIIGFLITAMGILFFSVNTAVLVDTIFEKMEALRTGRSAIIEKDHTLILGWTQLTIHIIREICLANGSEGGGVIAVLAPASKELMESELLLDLPIPRRYGTRVVLRTGSPMMLGDLHRVSAHTAKAVIILACSSDANESDAKTVRTILTLQSLYAGRRCCYIVAEVRDIDNEPLVRTVSDLSVEIVVSHDMIGRLMLMSVRQPGLNKLYNALLGFEGDEFYRKEWPQLHGLQFGDLQLRFPDAIPIGVQLNDGSLKLNPGPEYTMQSGDHLVVIAQDDDAYAPQRAVEIDVEEKFQHEGLKHGKQKILICGWRRDIRDVLKQMDKICKLGAQVHIITHTVAARARTGRLLDDGLDVNDLQNLIIVHWFGNTSCRRHLALLPMEEYTSCMIFADEAFELDAMYADSHSLATLLLVRDLQTNMAAQAQANARPVTPKFRKSGSAHSKVSGISLMSMATQSPRAKLGCSGSQIFQDVDMLATFMRQSEKEKDIKSQCPIICEILAPQTQQIIHASPYLAGISDFCQTNRLIGQVMAMVSEERAVKSVLDELLGTVGSSIAVVPFGRYTVENETISFYGLSQRALSLHEILIGYVYSGNNVQPAILNPPDKEKMRDDWHRCDFAVLTAPLSSLRDSEKESLGRGSDVRRSEVGGRRSSRLKEFREIAMAKEVQRDLRGIGSCWLPGKDKQTSWKVALENMNHADLSQLEKAVEVFKGVVDVVGQREEDEDEDNAVCASRATKASESSSGV